MNDNRNDTGSGTVSKSVSLDTNEKPTLKTKYRFTLHESVVNELNAFVYIHKYDDRKEFKEQWERWVSENTTLIEKERLRLQSQGYDGDIIDKMFKSVRYYLRKKPLTPSEPKQRRKYIGITREIITLMDTHICQQLQENTLAKPAVGYNEFYEMYNERILADEINRIHTTYNVEKDVVEAKIKKTYKNRYFIQTK